MTRWGKTLLAFTIGASSFIATETAPAGAAGETIVAGAVVDAATGLGIGGVDVGVVEVFTPGVIAAFAGGSVSQPDGTFQVFLPGGGSTSGSFQLMVIDHNDFYGSRYFLPVDVVPGTTTQTTVELERGGNVGGTISTAAGQVFGDLCVMLTDLAGNRMLRSDDSINCSAADGTYRTRAIPPGDYLASVQVALGSSFASVSNIPVSVVAGATTPLDLVLPAAIPTAITGRIVDAVTGQRLPGVGVNALVSSPSGAESQFFSVTSDVNGEFTMDVTGWANSPYPFHISVFDPSGLHQEQTGIEVFVQTGYTEPIEVAMQPGGALSVSVTLDTGEPTGPRCGALLDASRAVIASLCTLDQFQTPSLPEGDYFIQIPDQDSLHPGFVAGPFHVTLGEVTPVEIIVPTVTASITGVVVDVETGEPIAGAAAFVLFGDGSDTGLGGVRTDASGAFRIDVSGLLVRTHDFQVFAHDLLLRRYYQSASQQVTVADGQNVQVRIEMLKRTTLITGDVRDAVSGAPIDGIRISVTMPDGTSVEQLTAADGTFSIDAQPFVEFGTDFTIFADDPQGRYVSISPVSLTLQEGYAEPVGLVMQPRQVAGSTTATFARGSLRGVPAVNRRRAGSDVAVAFRVHDAGGALVRDRAVVQSVTYRAASCATWAQRGPTRTAAGSDRLRISRPGTMSFAWHAPRAPRCLVLTVTLTDGTTLRARVALTPPPRPRRR